MSEKDRLFQQLAAEEPPIQPDDTASSSTRPRSAIGPGKVWQQYAGGIMLLAALMLTIIATVLFLQGDDESKPIATVDDTVAIKPTVAVSTLAPTDRPTLSVQNTDLSTNNVLPTAAVDEAAVALLTPVPINLSNGAVVQRDNKPFTVLTGGTERGFSRHLIQSGDTLEALIKQYNLNDYCTIVWSNERRKISPLKIGSEIIIPPVDGVFYKIRESMTIAELSELTGVDAYSIIDSAYNPFLEGATPDNLLVEGMQIMVPGGNGGNCNVWSAKPTAGGSSDGSGSQIPSSYSLWGCSTPISSTGIPSLTPVGSYTFWQGFSSYHTGIDLSASTGTPVYAAGGGTVIFSGRNDYGYGNVVVIAHGSTFSLYAHLSDYNTACGQNVAQGQVIGSVGSTGNSTGPHLHFEIWNANADPVNPCYSVRC